MDGFIFMWNHPSSPRWFHCFIHRNLWNVGTSNMAHHYWKFNLVPSKWPAEFYLRPRDTSVIWEGWVKTNLMTNLMRRIYRNLFCGPSGHKCSCVSTVTVHFRAICRSVEKLERILMLWIGHYLSKEESINLTAGKHAWNRGVYVPSGSLKLFKSGDSARFHLGDLMTGPD